MRLLQVIPVFSDSFGGPVTVVKSISRQLAKKHDVTIYTTTALDSQHDSSAREEDVDGYRVVYFKRNFKRLSYTGLLGQLNISFDMFKEVKSKLASFDIVHVHSWQQFPDVLVHHYAIKYDVPYVLQVHGSLPRIMTKRRLKWFYDEVFGYDILRDASMVIALNETEAGHYKIFGVPNEKIAIIPNGIDLSEYSYLPSKGSFKKTFGLDKNEKIVLYLGRIHEIKGIDLLIIAFAKILHKFGDVRLVIVGPDDGYLREIEVLIKSLKIENKVLITGPLYGKDRLDVYVDANIYVLPSRYDAFGMTILEAMACGVPIILSEECGISSVVSNKTGIVVKPSPQNIEAALSKMLSDEKMQRVYSENCGSIIKQFDLSSLVSKLESVYQQI